MGRGIIETASVHGLNVLAVETNDGQRLSAQEAVAESISRAVRRGKIDLDSPDVAIDRIRWVDSIAMLGDQVDFVVEAISEKEAVKLALFRELDAVCQPHIILASNTSSISITKIGAATGRADRVVGMHFFNPVPVMAPVEIVRGARTSPETIAATHALASRMGKQSFEVADSPGFAVNRILMPLINEAVFVLQEQVADAESIDALMRLGCNHPMGPLKLADLVGLDVCLSILEVLHRDLGDPKFRPCPLLRRMVDAGDLGRKSGRGFYNYQ